MTLRRSPLDEQHRALDAQRVDFGGWEMPIAYPTGTIAEHLACRSGAAAFDVSHLGSIRVEGSGSFERLQSTLTNDLTKIAPGRAQYTHLLDDADGSVLDDIIVWWHPRSADDSDVFDVMPNASNTDRVVAALGGTDTTGTRAVIAVQGPDARAVLTGVFPEAAEVGRFRVAHCSWDGAPCVWPARATQANRVWRLQSRSMLRALYGARSSMPGIWVAVKATISHDSSSR